MRWKKKRGITIFSNQAAFQYGENTYYLVDTPGHADFSAEMERALTVMDYAVLIVSAVEGVQGHTETVWRLLEKERSTLVCFSSIKLTVRGRTQQRFFRKWKRSWAEISSVFPGGLMTGGWTRGFVRNWRNVMNPF